MGYSGPYREGAAESRGSAVRLKPRATRPFTGKAEPRVHSRARGWEPRLGRTAEAARVFDTSRTRRVP